MLPYRKIVVPRVYIDHDPIKNLWYLEMLFLGLLNAAYGSILSYEAVGVGRENKIRRLCFF